MSRAEKIEELERILHSSIEDLRTRIRHSAPCMNVCNSELILHIYNKAGVISMDRLQEWVVSYTISSFALDHTEDMNFLASCIKVSLARRAQRNEVERFSEIGGDCKCYQLYNWKWREWNGRIIEKVSTPQGIEYRVSIVKQAVFMEE